ALLPLVGEAKPLETRLTDYAQYYESRWREMMAAKLGLLEYAEPINAQLLNLLTVIETDMTLFFRHLADVDLTDPDGWQTLKPAFYRDEEVTPAYVEQLQAWLAMYQAELSRQQIQDRATVMNATNPKYVLRNYLAQMVIDEVEQGKSVLLERVMQVLKRPYDDQPEHDDLAARRPEWARTRVGCSMLSCSS
ncbi:MAG: protein adenylyltransferase SelO family protein, partial [Pseudomonadales bacterium]